MKIDWQAYVQPPDAFVTLPWAGGRVLQSADRRWAIDGPLPPHTGWHTFKLAHRSVVFAHTAEPQPHLLREVVTGYLVGDRVVPHGRTVPTTIVDLPACSHRVHAIEPGLDRFVVIAAGAIAVGAPLFYIERTFGGPTDDDVLAAFLDRQPSIAHVKHVSPALEAAFRLETWHREDTERRRAEAEAAAAARVAVEQAAAAAAAVAVRRQALLAQTGSSIGRREIAAEDFQVAARAALRVGDAELIDVRQAPMARERIVRYRLDGGRYECVCDLNLRIVDAGVCLTDHDGTKGDTWLTLESLPSVIREAVRLDKLVVFRHVG